MKFPAPAKLKSRLLLIPALVAACVLLPAITLHATQSDSLWDFSIGSQHLATINSPEGQLQIRVNGDMLVNQQESDIKEIDGKATIVERSGGQTRRIEFGNDGQHQLQRRYWLNGDEHAFDADAKKWLARVLPTMLRESGIDAEKRVARLFRQGGAELVLAEIGQINDSNSRSHYISLLARSGELSESQINRLIASTGKIDSDFELRKTLQSVVEQQKLNSEAQVAVLNLCANKIDSDFERRTLLQAISGRLLQDEAVTSAWQRAVEKIDSGFEARSAIISLAGRDDLNATQLNAALRASNKIDSDFEHRVALEALAKHARKGDAALVGNYLKSTEKISSDFERRVALMALIKKAELDHAGYGQLLHSLRDMGSDFEVCSVLKEVAKSLPNDQELIAQYHKVANNLGDFERQQAEKALSRYN